MLEPHSHWSYLVAQLVAVAIDPSIMCNNNSCFIFIVGLVISAESLTGALSFLLYLFCYDDQLEIGS